MFFPHFLCKSLQWVLLDFFYFIFFLTEDIRASISVGTGKNVRMSNEEEQSDCFFYSLGLLPHSQSWNRGKFGNRDMRDSLAASQWETCHTWGGMDWWCVCMCVYILCVWVCVATGWEWKQSKKKQWLFFMLVFRSFTEVLLESLRDLINSGSRCLFSLITLLSTIGCDTDANPTFLINS